MTGVRNAAMGSSYGHEEDTVKRNILDICVCFDAVTLIVLCLPCTIIMITTSFVKMEAFGCQCFY